jgi:N-acetylneuraminic acid mutarotase
MGLLWTRLADFPQDGVTVSSGDWGLRHAPPVGLIGTKVYLACGYSQLDSTPEQFETYEYDIPTDTWTMVTSGGSPVLCPHKHMYVSGNAVVNGELVAFGGSGNTSYLDRYDPTTKTWTTDDLPLVAGSSRQNIQYNCVASYNNKLYSFGGTAGFYSDFQNKGYIWDPAQPSGSRWSTTATWASVYANALIYQSIAVYQNKAYLIGGGRWASGIPDVAVTLIYDFASDSWTRGADLPTAMSYGVAGVIGSKIYYAHTGITYEYDPAADTWTTLSSLTTITTKTYEAAYISTGTALYSFFGDGALGAEPYAGYHIAQVLAPAVVTGSAAASGAGSLSATGFGIGLADGSLTGTGSLTSSGTIGRLLGPYLGAVVTMEN